jgi:hypothetical protein
MENQKEDGWKIGRNMDENFKETATKIRMSLG